MCIIYFYGWLDQRSYLFVWTLLPMAFEDETTQIGFPTGSCFSCWQGSRVENIQTHKQLSNVMTGEQHSPICQNIPADILTLSRSVFVLLTQCFGVQICMMLWIYSYWLRYSRHNVLANRWLSQPMPRKRLSEHSQDPDCQQKHCLAQKERTIDNTAFQPGYPSPTVCGKQTHTENTESTHFLVNLKDIVYHNRWWHPTVPLKVILKACDDLIPLWCQTGLHTIPI